MTNENRLHRNWFELMVRALAIFFLILFAYKIYRLFFIHDKLNDYLLSENLLHYEGGYIRRSLLGNLFIAFPREYWKMAVMVFYMGSLAALMVYVYRHCKNVYALLIFLCAPFGLRMLMFDFGSTYRKEFIFYLLIIGTIILYRKLHNKLAKLVAVSLLSALMIAVHESFIFLAMPVIAWIIYRNDAGLKHVAAYVFFCGLAFLLLSKTPTLSEIQALDRFFHAEQIDWSKTRLYMTFSKTDTLNMAWAHLMKGSILFYLLFFVPIVIYMFYSKMIRRDMALLLAIQLLFCAALCIIAIDYGRWLSFVLMSFLICLFSYDDLEGFAVRIRTSTKEKLVYVLILAFMLSVYLPHYIAVYNFREKLAEYSFIEKIGYSISEFSKENQ